MPPFIACFRWLNIPALLHSWVLVNPIGLCFDHNSPSQESPFSLHRITHNCFRNPSRPTYTPPYHSFQILPGQHGFLRQVTFQAFTYHFSEVGGGNPGTGTLGFQIWPLKDMTGRQSARGK